MKSAQENKTKQFTFLLYSSIAAFGAYFCMYAFRKPFTVARYDHLQVWGVDYKIALILLQVLGYATSKFIGIKVISELTPGKRKFYFLGLILMAELALFLFAIVPAPYNVVFMFLNGLPLGMIWGIVFSYLEGRKTTEILGIILCTSFIVSSGVVKSAGMWIMQYWGVSEFWMPVVTGALFLLPLLVFIFLLEKIPAPTAEDIAEKSERVPMNRAERKKVFRQFALPFSFLILFYTLLTAFRDFRDNFARELWDSIGYTGDVSVYSKSEIVVSLIVLLIFGALYFIKNNIKALYIYHYLLLLGIVTLAASTLLFQYHHIGAFIWMVATGFGLYICYVPFNALFFDRFIAAFKIKGNAGFLIYLADSFGYLGSMLVLLYKNFSVGGISWLDFFCLGTYILSAIALLAVLYSYFYLNRKFNNSENIHKEKKWKTNLTL
ncbi:TPA: MFS transporter [Elizabethkingia anophelis]|uniref:DUF5690 family protein n=1 Tax=Elizabethkingia anophelis TaxID=1117645 RepID=UPI000400438C|nr:DUF5690 family protein [Elizabethkingia anophelis]MCT3746714.1 hypothetical protein [Elizabethkingia anophelis]MDC8025901.1 DUF5690 family protein [Elizabethkingia anophelis]MDV3489591.1 hypothetical protein [Elizabethkingia anophelis]MDV4129420.1 hypothetical protein [Elizabethkingia anophelis]MDV4133219.1 hypothetical protein [Elizabethkingia anophelis]